MTSQDFTFTSESVSEGHPDKMCDQISDAVLDAHLASDPNSRVACETLVTTDFILVAGEITSASNVDYAKVARDVARDIGYVGTTGRSNGPHLHYEVRYFDKPMNPADFILDSQ